MDDLDRAFVMAPLGDVIHVQKRDLNPLSPTTFPPGRGELSRPPD